jgi:hypothetical protein
MVKVKTCCNGHGRMCCSLSFVIENPDIVVDAMLLLLLSRWVAKKGYYIISDPLDEVQTNANIKSDPNILVLCRAITALQTPNQDTRSVIKQLCSECIAQPS